MCPSKLQDHLDLQSSRLTDYAIMKSEILAYLENIESRREAKTGSAPMDVDALAAAASQMQSSLASLAKAKGKGKGGSKGGKGKGKSQDGGKGNDKGKQKGKGSSWSNFPSWNPSWNKSDGYTKKIRTGVVGTTKTPRVKAKVAKARTLQVKARVRVRR